MTIGSNGNLYVSNLLTPTIQEFSIEDGQFVSTFADIRSIGGGNINDLIFDDTTQTYFLTSGDSVFQLAGDGALLARFESEAFVERTGNLRLRHTNDFSTEGIAAELTPGAGLVGYATVNGSMSPIAFRYQQGRFFDPAILAGTIRPDAQPSSDVAITFEGIVTVPQTTTVKVKYAGGSSNGGHSTLQINGEQLGRAIGDDYRKHDVFELSLAAGEHSIKWTLTGGDFGFSMLAIQDLNSEALLPMSFARQHVRDVEISSVIAITSTEKGWPIPAEW